MSGKLTTLGKQPNDKLPNIPGLKTLVENGMDILKGENPEYVQHQSLVGRSIIDSGGPAWLSQAFAYVEYVSMEAGRMSGERAEQVLAQMSMAAVRSMSKLGTSIGTTANAGRLLAVKMNGRTRKIARQIDSVLLVQLAALSQQVGNLTKTVAEITSNGSGTGGNPTTPPAQILSASALGLSYLTNPAYTTDKRFQILIECTAPSPVTLLSGTLLNTVRLGVPRALHPAVLATPYIPIAGPPPSGGMAFVFCGLPTPSSGLTSLDGFNVYLAGDKTWQPGEVSMIDVVVVD